MYVAIYSYIADKNIFVSVYELSENDLGVDCQRNLQGSLPPKV